MDKYAVELKKYLGKESGLDYLLPISTETYELLLRESTSSSDQIQIEFSVDTPRDLNFLQSSYPALLVQPNGPNRFLFTNVTITCSDDLPGKIKMGTPLRISVIRILNK
jgi:hypothetical protein